MFGLSADEVRARFPAIYQHLLERVKPGRDQNPRASRRENWWLFAENQPRMRESIAGLSRYIVTVQTSKHRIFVLLDGSVLPDDKLIAIATEDAAILGVLSSQVHVVWALAAGATLEDRPVYNKSACFESFPFPDLHAADKFGGPIAHSPEDADRNCGPVNVSGEHPTERIRRLAEELDAHRKRQQAAHPGLTLTGMYNVLEKLRAGEPLSAKERAIHEQGLVSVLRQLHDDLDAAVLEAYGWSDLLPLLRVAHGNESPADSRRRCWIGWSRSMPSAPPRRRAASCAGCARSSRIPRAVARHRSSPPWAAWSTTGATRRRRPSSQQWRCRPATSRSPGPGMRWSRCARWPRCWPAARIRCRWTTWRPASPHAAHGSGACRSCSTCSWHWAARASRTAATNRHDRAAAPRGSPLPGYCAPQHFLYFFPLPQGHGSLRPRPSSRRNGVRGVSASTRWRLRSASRPGTLMMISSRSREVTGAAGAVGSAGAITSPLASRSGRASAAPIQSCPSSQRSQASSRRATPSKKPSAQSWPTSSSSSCSASSPSSSGSSGSHISGARCSGRSSPSKRARAAHIARCASSRPWTSRRSASLSQRGSLPPQTTGLHSSAGMSSGETARAERKPSSASRLKPRNGTARRSSRSDRRSIWPSSRPGGAAVMGEGSCVETCMVAARGGLPPGDATAGPASPRCSYRIQPPSTVSSAPVTKLASGPAR